MAGMAFVEIAHLAQRLLAGIAQHARAGQQHIAQRREAYAAPGTLEQRAAHGQFQALYAFAQRGLGTPQLFCGPDRKSTRLNSSHLVISYAVFCLKKKNKRECSMAQPTIHYLPHALLDRPRLNQLHSHDSLLTALVSALTSLLITVS